MTTRRYRTVEDFEFDAKGNFDKCTKCQESFEVLPSGEIITPPDYLAAPYGLAIVYTTPPATLKAFEALNAKDLGRVSAQALLVKLPVMDNLETLFSEFEAMLESEKPV